MLFASIFIYFGVIGTDPSLKTFIDCRRAVDALPGQGSRRTRRLSERLLHQSSRPRELSKREYQLAKTLMEMAQAGKLRIFFIESAHDTDMKGNPLLEINPSSQLATERSKITETETSLRRKEVLRDEKDRELKGKQEQVAVLLGQINQMLRDPQVEPATRLGNSLVVIAEASTLNSQSISLQRVVAQLEDDIRSNIANITSARHEFIRLSGPTSLELIFERAGVLESYRRWESRSQAQAAWKEMSLFYRLEVRFLRSLVGAGVVGLMVWYGGPVASDILHRINPQAFMTGTEFTHSLRNDLIPYVRSLIAPENDISAQSTPLLQEPR